MSLKQGKIICMERNHRIAKAYARSPVININGGNIGFDGDCIGLSGFDNPYRDSEALSINRRMGSEGFFVAADDDGNIFVDVNRCRSRIHVTNASTFLLKKDRSLRNNRNTTRNCHIRRQRLPSFRQTSSSDFTKTDSLPPCSQKSGLSLGFGRSHKIFEMKSFLKALNQELLLESQSPESRNNSIFLSSQCISILSFDVKGTEMNCGEDVLETPVWIMIINVIALEMLHKNLNTSES
jgi:hypothetical protein